MEVLTTLVSKASNYDELTLHSLGQPQDWVEIHDKVELRMSQLSYFLFALQEEYPWLVGKHGNILVGSKGLNTYIVVNTEGTTSAKYVGIVQGIRESTNNKIN